MPLHGQREGKGSISCHLRKLWQSPLLATCSCHSRSWGWKTDPSWERLELETGSKAAKLLGCSWDLHCPGVTLLRQTIRKECGHFHWHFKGLCPELCPGIAVNDFSGIWMDLELQTKLLQSLICTHRALRGNRKKFYPAPKFVHCRHSSALHSQS